MRWREDGKGIELFGEMATLYRRFGWCSSIVHWSFSLFVFLVCYQGILIADFLYGCHRQLDKTLDRPYKFLHIELRTLADRLIADARQGLDHVSLVSGGSEA